MFLAVFHEEIGISQLGMRCQSLEIFKRLYLPYVKDGVLPIFFKAVRHLIPYLKNLGGWIPVCTVGMRKGKLLSILKQTTTQPRL